MNAALISRLAVKTPSRIFHLVIDGLGGLPHPATGKTELETARTPNLDRLAHEAALGLSIPIDYGITPGSGPAHLSLFGYDPLEFEVGRGILDILGAGYDLRPGDVAARINFCTIDDAGVITDRRAGRIGDDEGRRVCALLDGAIKVPGVDVSVFHTKEYRGGVILRRAGGGLDGDINDTDPQKEGLKPLAAVARSTAAEETADILNQVADQARAILSGETRANMILLRGVDTYRPLPSFADRYKLNPYCIAVYPMYRGVAKLLGMTLADIPGTASVPDQFGELERVWGGASAWDYIFFHVKKTDSAGEDGDFDKKVHVLEDLDREIPRLLALKPDVIVVTGDHSTPAQMKSHSWHPLPTMLHSAVCRRDAETSYGESACTRGGLGTFKAVELMPLALANAGKLLKFGA